VFGDIPGGVAWHTVSSVAMRANADLVAAVGPDRLAEEPLK